MKLQDILLSIPHAGEEIPPEIRSRIAHGDEILRQETDLYTDRIYQVSGPKIVQARHSRIISDPNRAPDEIYIEGKNRSLGVIMLDLAEGEPTFSKEPSIEEMERWIREYHAPYHAELSHALPEAKFIIDCHSMWSTPAPMHIDAGTKRAEVIIGNREYTSCSAEATHFFCKAFEELGYDVAINDPYPGRYILGAYCSRLYMPGLQIEYNRSLYLDEETLEGRDEDIARLNAEFTSILEQFCEWDEERSRRRPMTDMSDLQAA